MLLTESPQLIVVNLRLLPCLAVFSGFCARKLWFWGCVVPSARFPEMLSRIHFRNRHHASASVANVFALRCTLGLPLDLATMLFLISLIVHVVMRSGNRSPFRQLSGAFPSANTYAPREVVESIGKALIHRIVKEFGEVIIR